MQVCLHPSASVQNLRSDPNRTQIKITQNTHWATTYSTWAEPTGENIKALQAQLGHTDSRLGLGVYTHPMPEAQAKIASKVARVLLPTSARWRKDRKGRFRDSQVGRHGGRYGTRTCDFYRVRVFEPNSNLWPVLLFNTLRGAKKPPFCQGGRGLLSSCSQILMLRQITVLVLSEIGESLLCTCNF